MMRVLLVLLLWLVPMSLAAKPCPTTLKCPKGATVQRSERAIWCSVGRLPHGPQFTCSGRGDLLEEDHYRDGVRHGRHRKFTKDGKLLIDETFVDGVVHGVSKSWYPGGDQLSSEIEMKHGQQDGLERRWHPTGTLAKRAHFRDGKQVGRTETWHINGARQLIANFDDGELHGERQQYHPNNWIHEVAHFDHGRLVGEYFRSSDDGEVEVRGQYANGLKVGEWLDDFGQGPATGRYDAGKKVGEWRFFDRQTGELVRVAGYADDVFHGKFERYEGGQLVERGSYSSNLRDGVWETYSGEQVMTRATWDEGMRLENCERKGKKLKCTKQQTPYRMLSVQCATKLDTSGFVSSAAEFDEHFVSCSRPAPIDWDRHHVYAQRLMSDPNDVRFARIEKRGNTHVMVFERGRVCRGTAPPPPVERWVVVVVPRSITTMEMQTKQVGSNQPCGQIP